jgi:hypothetical protein
MAWPANTKAKEGAGNPFVDPDGYKAYIAERERIPSPSRRNPRANETLAVFQNDADSALMQFGTRDRRGRSRENEGAVPPLLKTWPTGRRRSALTLIRFDADRGDFRDSPGGLRQVLAVSQSGCDRHARPRCRNGRGQTG